MAFVYILACGDGTLYTGAAADWKLRLKEHRNGKGAKYTRGRQPPRLKKLTKKQKEKLIAEFQAETAALTETVGV